MAKMNAINNKSGSLTLDPGASGDSFIQFDINTTGEFRIGVDDDDLDKFKISQGSALGSNDTMVITAAGEITYPLTSAFCASVTAWGGTNVTGDGTDYTIAFTTEYFDQNSDFDGTSTFTAPVTGKYYITASVLVDEVSACTSSQFKIVTSNRTYKAYVLNVSQYAHAANYQATYSLSALADFDASDTATIHVDLAGGGKVVDIGYGGRGMFSANLVC